MSAPLPNWLQRARADARQPPLRARLPLFADGYHVGSVEHGILDEIVIHSLLDVRYKLSMQERFASPVWCLEAQHGELTAAFDALARALRALGHCGPWRNEQLAVCTAQGKCLGTIERGLVRVLGIATQAVHLVGLAPGGRMWVQQRAFDKPNNPGQWDTLMGGMVSAADTLDQALARETWEEAGLRMSALVDVVHGGQVDFERPSREGGGTGYMRERIDWFSAVVPEGRVPRNQDGEVACFELLPFEAVRERVVQGLFTPEATLVLAACWRL
ncbi:MAG TPA: NUDIX hydrolase [Comamonadaceae bacterium]|nr:NUDIX hydrolase [Comamonadaceae bacterium]